MTVRVHLPSGDGCSIPVFPETPVSELKATAQQHFQRHLMLTANGRLLDLTAAESEAGLQDDNVVIAVVQLGKPAAADLAFAWHDHGGQVVTWGDPECSGDISQVQDQLRNVQHIQATSNGAVADS